MTRTASANQVEYVIQHPGQLAPVMSQAMEMAGRGLKGGPVRVILTRVEQKRSSQANRLMWKLLTDIAEQVEWGGGKLTPEDWKDLITAVMHKQRVLPGLDGGLVALGRRSSKMKKAEFSDLIECIYSVGVERGVEWSPDTSTDWAQYKEA